MPLFVNLKSCLVGLLVLGSLVGCSDSSDKSAAKTEITSLSTTTTTTIPIPPTTVYGTPDSYEPPPSWPTEPGLGDPTTVDLAYVQHVMDAFAAVDGLERDALMAAETVDDKVQLIIAEYSYGEEMVAMMIEETQKSLVKFRGKTHPGRLYMKVNKVTSVSPRCFVTQVTVNRDEVLPGEEPFDRYYWMGIPPDERFSDIYPSPWRLLGLGQKLTRPAEKCGDTWDF
ncbi:MAG: hypothetical protein ACSLFB_01370 [Acidimicrobiales bacterium]